MVVVVVVAVVAVVVAVVIVIASRPYVRLSRGGGEAMAVAVAMISFVLSAMPLIYGLPGVSVSIMRSL
jgi:hypothetical protein